MSPLDPKTDFLRFRDHGDPEALARVFDALAPKLLLLAQHLTRDGAGAEDLVQATFLAAMRDARGYDGRPLVAWLGGILAHRARDEGRRARVRAAAPLGTEPDASGDPLALAADREMLARIGDALDALDEPYREVLVLRVVHGLAPSAIAHALGRAPGTVRMQLQRAREKLRERLPQSLTLPALFWSDDGAGLAALRKRVLREATPAGTASLLGGLPKVAAALGIVFALGGLWWSARDERPATVPEALASTPPARAVPTRAPNPAGSGTSEVPPTPAADRREVAAGAPRAEEPSPALVHVEGQVLSLARSPVAGAEIQAVEPGSGGRGRALTTSDTGGRFRVEVAPEVLLVARKPGLQPSANRRTRLAAAAGETVAVVLVMGADGHALAGAVSDPRGEPVPGAAVAVLVDEDARKQREGLPVAREAQGTKPLDREAFVLVTDANGRFETNEAPAGGAVVLARSPESGLIGVGTVEVRPGLENRCEVRLGPGATILGRVLDERERACAELEVLAEWKGEPTLGSVDDHDWGPEFANRAVRTSADGRYELDGLLPGRHEVRVQLGGRTLARERLELAASERRAFDVEVPATVPVAVRALDPDGNPLAGWGLAWGAGDELDFELARELDMPLALDAGGRLDIAGLAPVAHVFALYAPAASAAERLGRIPCASRAGIVPEAAEIELRLKRAELPDGRLRGAWLRARGAPCAGFELELERADLPGTWQTTLMRTDAAGRFEFTGLAAGSYRVLADEDGVYPRRALLAEATLAPGATLELGELSLEDPTRLVVDLRTEDGRRPEEASGTVRSPEAASELLEWMSWSADEQVLRSRPLPSGEVLLGVAAQGYAEAWKRLVLAPGPENHAEVVLRRGSEVELRVTLPPIDGPGQREARPGYGRVQLSLTDPEGAPVLDGRLEGPWVGGNTREVALRVRLAAGHYTGHVVDHSTDPGPRPRRSAEVRFEVREHGSGTPIRVVIR